MGLRRMLVRMLDPEGHADGQGIVISGGKFVIDDLPGGVAHLPVFDVVTYGAVVDGTTDDTAAWQDAIDAAYAAGGGRVISSIAGVSIIAGALQDTSGANAQLILPSVDYADSECVTIVIEGAIQPPAVGSVIGTTPLPDGYLVLKSTLATGSGGRLLGGVGPTGTFESFTNVNLVLRNVGFRTPADWTHTAVDLLKVATCDLDGVVIDAGSFSINSISVQTTSTSYGLKLPDLNNGAHVRLGQVDVVGFYNAVLVNEHTLGQYVAAWGCKQAYTFAAGYHASRFIRLAAYHCQHGIAFTGDHRTQIDQYDVEHAATGNWVPVADIDDSSNQGYGAINWHVVKAGVGVDTTFTINGGTNLLTNRVGTTDRAPLASPALTGNPTAPTQTAGNNSTRVATTAFVTTAVAGATGTTVYYARDKLTATAGNDTLTLGATPLAKSEEVWVNGTHKWVTDDYTISGGVITFGTALSASDVVRVRYATTNSSPSASALSTATGTTYVADNFNRTDSASSLGSTSTGSVAWSALVGTWGISSNAAYSPGSGATLRVAVVESGHADCTVSFKVGTSASTAQFGPAFRAVDANNHWIVECGNGSSVATLFKRVGGGSYTSVASSAGNVHFAAGDTISAVLSGSSITIKQNGTTIITATDSAFSTATKHGLHIYSLDTPATTIDDFSVTA